MMGADTGRWYFLLGVASGMIADSSRWAGAQCCWNPSIHDEEEERHACTYQKPPFPPHQGCPR
jgi:hypothetical protein